MLNRSKIKMKPKKALELLREWEYFSQKRIIDQANRRLKIPWIIKRDTEK